MEQSTTGEAANMEIALLLGMTGQHAPQPMRSRLPALRPEAIAMLGQRETRTTAPKSASRASQTASVSTAWRSFAAIQNSSRHRRLPTLLAGLLVGGCTSTSTCSTERSSAPAVLPAMHRCRKGLTWANLTSATRTVLQTHGCRGWSIGVYNPDLDPDGRDAQRIVAYLADVTDDSGARTAR
jgi:arginase